VKNPHRVRSATDARDDSLRQPTGALEHLLARLASNDRLKLTHHPGIGRGSNDRTDDVVAVIHRRHPITNRFTRCVLQRPRSARHWNDGRSHESHAEHVQLLAPHVFFTHVDHALQTESGADRRRRDTVLARSSLGNDSALPHSQCEERLADRIVDLVRAGVVQVLALQEHTGPDQVGQPGRTAQRRWTTDICMKQIVELSDEGCVRHSRCEGCFELVERRNERLRDIAPAIGAESIRGVSCGHRFSIWPAAAEANARMRA